MCDRGGAGVWLLIGEDAEAAADADAEDVGPGVWLRGGAGVWLRIGEDEEEDEEVGWEECDSDMTAGVTGLEDIDAERPWRALNRALALALVCECACALRLGCAAALALEDG